jgi:hypothetical protein
VRTEPQTGLTAKPRSQSWVPQRARTDVDVAVSEPVALLVDEEELVAVLLGVADAEREPVAVCGRRRIDCMYTQQRGQVGARR